MFKNMINKLRGKSNITVASEPLGPPAPVEKKLEIIDWREELPTHPTRTWNKRDLTKINQIVVHQGGGSASIKQVAKYHITPGKDNHLSDKGAPGIAYTYAIDPEGKVYYVTDEKFLTWHIAKQNGRSIGILVIGDFDGKGHERDTDPTDAQIDALPLLLEYLTERYPSAIVGGHGELAAETNRKDWCPGYILDENIKNYRS